MEPQRVKEAVGDARGTSQVIAEATVVRRAVFTLGEGDVVIEFPRDLSKESVEDLADYLDIFMKRARREAQPKDAKAVSDEAAN